MAGMCGIIAVRIASTLLILSSLNLQVCGQRRCSRVEKRCPGGFCIKSWETCPVCTERNHVPCPDGTCVLIGRSCFFKGCTIEEKKCPGGQCVLLDLKCSDGCPYNEKRCDDDSCVANDRFCKEEKCPDDRSERCGDGDCYALEERCDGTAFCKDGSDEIDCSFSFDKILETPWLIVIISVTIFALFCLIIALCCRYRHNEERRRRERRVARHRQHQQQNYEEMPALAGRRMQPLTTRQQSSSTPGQDPRSPSFSSVPSPYNPELVPFMSPNAFSSSPGAQSPYQQPITVSQRAEPSAPPLGLEPHLAPPPYHEAMAEGFVIPGVPGRDYLPSYETVQRSGPPGPNTSDSPRV